MRSWVARFFLAPGSAPFSGVRPFTLPTEGHGGGGIWWLRVTLMCPSLCGFLCEHFHSLGKIQRLVMAGWEGRSVVSFVRNGHTVFQKWPHILCSHQKRVTVPLAPRPHRRVVLSGFWKSFSVKKQLPSGTRRAEFSLIPKNNSGNIQEQLMFNTRVLGIFGACSSL